MVRVYTLVGELVYQFTADDSGTANWDGKNSHGENLGDDVYLAEVESTLGNQVLKIGVQK